jgi:hypothetical protein
MVKDEPSLILSDFYDFHGKPSFLKSVIFNLIRDYRNRGDDESRGGGIKKRALKSN